MAQVQTGPDVRERFESADLLYGWEYSTDLSTRGTAVFKHVSGVQVVLMYDYPQGGWHADQRNPKWDRYTRWLTGTVDGRPERRARRGSRGYRREAIDLRSAWRAADDEMIRVYRRER